jgi:hypothetical protein
MAAVILLGAAVSLFVAGGLAYLMNFYARAPSCWPPRSLHARSARIDYRDRDGSCPYCATPHIASTFFIRFVSVRYFLWFAAARLFARRLALCHRRRPRPERDGSCHPCFRGKALDRAPARCRGPTPKQGSVGRSRVTPFSKIASPHLYCAGSSFKSRKAFADRLTAGASLDAVQFSRKAAPHTARSTRGSCRARAVRAPGRS